MEQCKSCSRKFKDVNGLRQHARAKGHEQLRPADNDDGPSIASLMIEAQIDRAMGNPIDDWLADMLPD